MHKTHRTQGKIAPNDSSQFICRGYSNHEIHYEDILAKKKMLQHFLVDFYRTFPSSKCHLKNKSQKPILPLVYKSDEEMWTAEFSM